MPRHSLSSAYNAYILANPTQSTRSVAAHLGIDISAVRRRRTRLGLAPLRAVIDTATVIERLEDGALCTEVAAELGVTAEGIAKHLRRERDITVLDMRGEYVYLSSDLARIFGVHQSTARRWMLDWRKARVTRVRKTRRHSPARITGDDLIALLTSPAGKLYVARIVDPLWRDYFAETGTNPVAPHRAKG